MRGIFTNLCLFIVVMLLISACASVVGGVPEERDSSPSSVSNGRQLITKYGCGSCHSIPGVVGAKGLVAPPLEHFYERMYIAGRLANTTDNLVKWIQDPQAVEPGTAMPTLGVTESEARDIAAY